MHNNQSQETIDTKIYPWGNHKVKNPATSSEIEWAPMAAVKPKDIKMITNSCSLSHLCTIVGWVCATNKEAHSLFILVSDLTITYQSQLL